MFHVYERFRWVGVAALIAGYAVLVHYVNVTGHPSRLGTALAMMPVFGFALAMFCSAASRVGGALLLGGSGFVSWHWWQPIAQHAGVLFWLQDLGLVLTLLFVFGRTLLPGRKPLCVGFAEMLHGPLDARHERYARRVTVAWTLLFVALASISTLLFFMEPLVVWSFYANFLVLPIIGLMFVAEFMVRRKVLPQAATGKAFDALRAYLKSSSQLR